MPDIYIKEVKWACLTLGIYAKDSRVFILQLSFLLDTELNYNFQLSLQLSMTTEHGQKWYNYFWAWIIKQLLHNHLLPLFPHLDVNTQETVEAKC